ncbi:MAG: RNA 2',3'-cyclic phosphodiesterase [Sulfuricaulis sp.]
MTLAFLVSVPASFRRCAEQVPSAIRCEAFAMTLEQIGCWSRFGILWTGPVQVPKALLQLVKALNTGLIACGYVPEKRHYTAHMTLARQVRPCQERQLIEPLTWDVYQFCLVQSKMHSDGARYEILRTWRLNPPTA